MTKQPLQEHIAYMAQLNAGGKLYMGGSLNAGTLDTTQPAGLIVIDAQSPEDALEVMHNDPAIRAGIVEGACYPWYFLLVLQPQFLKKLLPSSPTPIRPIC